MFTLFGYLHELLAGFKSFVFFDFSLLTTFFYVFKWHWTVSQRWKTTTEIESTDAHKFVLCDFKIKNPNEMSLSKSIKRHTSRVHFACSISTDVLYDIETMKRQQLHAFMFLTCNDGIDFRKVFKALWCFRSLFCRNLCGACHKWALWLLLRRFSTFRSQMYSTHFIICLLHPVFGADSWCVSFGNSFDICA